VADQSQVENRQLKFRVQNMIKMMMMTTTLS